jgi:hypothetical protein
MCDADNEGDDGDDDDVDGDVDGDVDDGDECEGGENDDYMHYADENDAYNSNHQIEENNENNLNGISMANMEESDDAKVESISLTGYDGERFIASYLVVMSTINNV